MKTVYSLILVTVLFTVSPIVQATRPTILADDFTSITVSFSLLKLITGKGIQLFSPSTSPAYQELYTECMSQLAFFTISLMAFPRERYHQAIGHLLGFITAETYLMFTPADTPLHNWLKNKFPVAEKYIRAAGRLMLRNVAPYAALTFLSYINYTKNQNVVFVPVTFNGAIY